MRSAKVALIFCSIALLQLPSQPFSTALTLRGNYNRLQTEDQLRKTHPHPFRITRKYTTVDGVRKKIYVKTKLTLSPDEKPLKFSPEKIPPRRTYPVIQTQRSVCRARTAGDVLDYALRRIGNHLFLTNQRLDHFLGTGYFDPEFASKYLHADWESYTASRNVSRYGSCAVVGNSGHLRLSNYGPTIEAFDAVIRTNQAPIKGYTKYVGAKTTFRLMNRAMARRYQVAMEDRYNKLRSIKNLVVAASGAATRDEWNATGGDETLEALSRSAALNRLGVTLEMLSSVPVEGEVITKLKNVLQGVGDSEVKVNDGYFPLEKNTTVILVTEMTSLRTEMESFIRAARKLRPDVSMVVESGKTREIVEDMLLEWYSRMISCHGAKIPKGQGARPTTGVMALITMLKQCDSVALFGFGAPANGTSSAPYHYYSDCEACMPREHQTASSSVHFFNGEAQFIKQLQEEGRITICSELDGRYCGLPEEAVRRLTLKQVAEEAEGPGGVDVDEDLGDGGRAEPDEGEDEENEEARNYMLEQMAVVTPVGDIDELPGTSVEQPLAEGGWRPTTVQEGPARVVYDML
mmetsp:Transcript_39908/g.113198  ORF Transcript_39908/g.113198 Transcript_39908/m.113198 type:complete len:576 (+) Transcript_39908:233-1960(+)|eukprot:CAMPEP_0117651766 /NCGR_PEP_ID=MMETSP0804-20121206/2268_1 /TAXON_ID=1074897 /ORGANISM="Tetraselmis astigmatica, Strain CCMP880" /LENGTH=575 /DNA_ID=CAMNT_0005457767 /DNA_START=176 /DNA_END=1903 /DNA_ORIENTATION=-